MSYGVKRGLAIALCAGLSFSALTGCAKKEDNSKKAAITVNGNVMNANVANFLVRYNQAQFENGIGQLYAAYGYTDIWNTDMYGTGELYSETFKGQLADEFVNMLLAQEHAADYGVELTDEEKAAVTQAAADFIASNSADTLEKMSADQETVEAALTLYAIQNKVQKEMVKDVDTEVSDEEAAQRTVSYVNYTATTEAATEAVTEGESESVLEETMTASEEPETLVEEAEMTESQDTKTGAADETETEAAESVNEDAEAATEAVSEEVSEAETETDSPEMAAAKAECLAMAEAFLAKAQKADSFEEAAAEENENNDKSRTSSFTFGKDDTYPDAAIIEATNDLADDTVVDHVVQVGNTYYVLHVDKALDREATDTKKEQIVEQRKSDKIAEIYEGYLADEESSIDEDVFAAMLFNFSLTQPATEASTETVEEAVSEAVSEAGTEDARVE